MRDGQAAVIFDLDGTLIDSVPDLHVAVNRLLNEEGQPAVTAEAVAHMVGEGASRLVERAFAAVDIVLSSAAAAHYTERFREIYLEAPCVRTTLMPDVRECLDALATRGAPLGVCTNKPIAHTRAILERLDLARYFAAVLGGDSLTVRKPDAEPLLATLARLQAAPAASVFVGDSRIDLETARAAAVAAILVEGGYTDQPVREMPADAHIARLAELDAALARVRLWP